MITICYSKNQLQPMHGYRCIMGSYAANTSRMKVIKTVNIIIHNSIEGLYAYSMTIINTNVFTLLVAMLINMMTN